MHVKVLRTLWTIINYKGIFPFSVTAWNLWKSASDRFGPDPVEDNGHSWLPLLDYPREVCTRGRAPWLGQPWPLLLLVAGLSPGKECIGHISGDYPRKFHVKDDFKSKSLFNSLALWSRMPQKHYKIFPKCELHTIGAEQIPVSQV